jgi:hypothetical protein
VKKVIRNLALGSVAIFGVAASHVIYLYNHREFGPKDFHHPFILSLNSSIVPDSEVKSEASKILNQRFNYLSYGGQMTVYESEDGKYVIKFFNPRSVIKENWFHQFSKLRRFNSLRWITNTYFRQKVRLQKYFLRYEQAFKDLKEETGLVYVHLDPSTCLSQTLEVVDKEGSLHQVPLDGYPFVLQKKVELTMHHIDRLLKKGDMTGAQESIRQIYDLFLSRARKGYTDRLQTLHKNYGFFEGHAVQLDVGRIRKLETIQQKPLQEVERIVGNITASIAENYPQLAPLLQECLEKSKNNQ